MSYYGQGGTDYNAYLAKIEAEHGKKVADEAVRIYNAEFKKVVEVEHSLIGTRVGFLNDEGKRLHGKVTAIDARNEDSTIAEYEVTDDSGDIWTVTPQELTEFQEGMVTLVEPAYPYNDPQPPMKINRKRKENVMLANKGDVTMLDSGKWAELKLDGTRGWGIVSPTGVYLTGRSWKSDFGPRYPKIMKDLGNLNAQNVVLDGEIVFVDKKGKIVFLTALAKKSTIKEQDLTPVFLVYDIPYLENNDLTSLPYEERRRILSEVVPAGLTYVRENEIVKTGQKKFYKKVLKEEGEGLMLKDPTSPYVFRRSNDWRKLKPMFTEGKDTYDVAVIGYTAGKGKFKGQLGALLLAQRVGREWYYVGKTSGMDDDTRKDLTKRLKARNVSVERMPKIHDFEGDELEFTEAKVLTMPKLVVKVTAAERLKSGVFRHPVFERERPDKRATKTDVGIQPISSVDRRLLRAIKAKGW